MNTLLSQDADFDIVNERGETALHCAASSGCAEAVKVLLDLGSSIEALTLGKETALHTAGRLGHAKVVDLLVDRGANIEAREGFGCTPLHLAARATAPPAGVHMTCSLFLLLCFLHLPLPPALCLVLSIHPSGQAEKDTQQALQKAGPPHETSDATDKPEKDPDSSDDSSDVEPPILEEERLFADRLHVVETLLRAGADLKAANRNSETVLHYAAIGGHGPTITTLLIEGADLQSLTGSG